MIKRLSVLFFAIAFVFTAVAQDRNVGQEKMQTPDPTFQAPVSQSTTLEKVNAVGELFMQSDYDYGGNNVIPKMIDIADIDQTDNLDPFFVGMRRDNTVTPAVARFIPFGYKAFGAPIDVFSAFNPAQSLGWGTTQLCVGGPLDGKALVMAHAGGTSWHSVIDLVNLEPVQPFPSVTFGGNFPDFYYHSDGTIWTGNTDGMIRKSTDQGGSFTDVAMIGAGDPNVTITIGSGPSENPIYGAAGGQYMATVGAWALIDTVAQDDGVYWYGTNDFGATWNGLVIGKDGYFGSVANNANLAPFFENFGQLNANLDETGTTHLVMNGYGAGINTQGDTVDAFPLLYWNSNAAEWLEISVPAIAFEPGTTLADLRPGNGIGQSYPSVSVTNDGQIVFVIWTAPEYTGAVGASAINIYAGTASIFYTDLHWSVSTDGGTTWSAPSVIGDPNVSETYANVARRLEVTPTGDVIAHFVYFVDAIPGTSLFAGGNENAVGDWMYHSATIATVGVDENPTLVNNFNLEQNYPNPFNPSTTIKYSVAERSNVNIKVYDMLGKEVANLVNTVKEAGSHEVSFNASNLASGMYVYTITAGNFTSSKKMMLMK